MVRARLFLFAAPLLALVALVVPRARADKPVAAPAPPKIDAKAASRIEVALREQITWEFVDFPLADVVEKIKEDHKINVVFDKKALEDAGAASDTPITFKVSGITLRSALKHLLANMDLTYIYDDLVLTITTPEKANNHLITEVYDVRDLIGDAARPAFDSIIDLITTIIAPTTWDEVGGPGSLKEHTTTLVISQTQDVQDQIQQLLRALRAAKAERIQPDLRIWALEEPALKALEKTRQALKSHVTLRWQQRPLTALADYLIKEHGLHVLFDRKALEESGAGTDTPISINLVDVPLATALNLVLKSLDLTYYTADEVMLISTPEKANNQLLTAVYPVSEIIRLPVRPAEQAGEGESAYDGLIELISTTIAPTTWDDVGGPASIKQFDRSRSLVVSQTEEVHDQILALLEQLRAKETPIAGDAPQAVPAEPDSSFVVRIYLLNSTGNVPAGAGGMGGGYFQTPKQKAQPAQNPPTPPANAPQSNPMLAAELAAAIKEVIEPSAWDARGTTIRPIGGNLVVRQTPPVQRKIAEFLKKLGVLSGQR